MESAEGASTALSVLLSRFKILLSICLYDNLCNAYISASIRLPRVEESKKLLVSRFHYKSHKCTSVLDSNSYISCDYKRRSAAESLNRVRSASKSYVRFLDP